MRFWKKGEIPGDFFPVVPKLFSVFFVKIPGRHKEKLRYDEIYYDNLSFKNDVKIIFKTIYEVIFHKLDEN